MNKKNNSNQAYKIIEEYKKIYDRLSDLDEEMRRIRNESEELIQRLEELRKEEKNLNNYGKEKE